MASQISTRPQARPKCDHVLLVGHNPRTLPGGSKITCTRRCGTISLTEIMCRGHVGLAAAGEHPYARRGSCDRCHPQTVRRVLGAELPPSLFSLLSHAGLTCAFAVPSETPRLPSHRSLPEGARSLTTAALSCGTSSSLGRARHVRRSGAASSSPCGISQEERRGSGRAPREPDCRCCCCSPSKPDHDPVQKICAQVRPHARSGRPRSGPRRSHGPRPR